MIWAFSQTAVKSVNGSIVSGLFLGLSTAWVNGVLPGTFSLFNYAPMDASIFNIQFYNVSLT